MNFFNNRWQTMTLVLFLTILGGVFSLARAADISDTTIATVNSAAVTQKDLDIELNRIKAEAAGRGQAIDESQMEAVKVKLIETLIHRELLYQQSEAKGFTTEPSELENRMENIKQQLPPGKNFADILTEIDISQAAFEKEISKAIMIQKLLEAEVYGKVSVSEKEVRIFYDNNPQFFKVPEQVEASHILIQVGPEADQPQKESARKRIEEIQAKLKQGEDFAELAQNFSECPSSKNGGNLGLFDRRKMVKPFADAAFALNAGEVSDIVETRFGYHIIKVIKKIPETKLSYADIKDRLQQTLQRQKIQKETVAYIEQLKKTADIQRISQ